MALNADKIAHLCNIISHQINERFKTLTVYFIAHHHGQRLEALGLAGQDISWHPASETAMHLLTSADHTEESTLIGTAVAHENIFLGLATRNSTLALCSLNTDQFNTLQEIKCHAYHMAWHAIDSFLYHEQLEGGYAHNQSVIVRQRNALEITSANLMADVFAVTMSTLTGSKNVIATLAKLRGENVLNARCKHAEQYPFPIAANATANVLRKIRSTTLSKKRFLDAGLDVARSIGDIYTEDIINEWLAFAEPAQDMAWRGTDAADILGAAMNTSDDTDVRSIACLIAETTGIRPDKFLEQINSYNSYAGENINEKMHEKIIDDIFEDVIARGLEAQSSAPFRELANQQNTGLLNGKVLGWCAAALQASGMAFENALANGNLSPDAARHKFDKERYGTTWDSLKKLGQKIIQAQRDGENITMEKIEKMAGSSSLSSLRKSIQTSQKELAAGLAPAGPALGTAPNTPKAMPAMAYAGPAHGGPALGRTAARPRRTIHQHQTEQNGTARKKEQIREGGADDDQ